MSICSVNYFFWMKKKEQKQPKYSIFFISIWTFLKMYEYSTYSDLHVLFMTSGVKVVVTKVSSKWIISKITSVWIWTLMWWVRYCFAICMYVCWITDNWNAVTVRWCVNNESAERRIPHNLWMKITMINIV